MVLVEDQKLRNASTGIRENVKMDEQVCAGKWFGIEEIIYHLIIVQYNHKGIVINNFLFDLIVIW